MSKRRIGKASPGKVETGFPSGTKQGAKAKKPAKPAARAGEVAEDAVMQVRRRWGRRPAADDVLDLAKLAMRCAQTLDGAPARCNFRECRDGRCHLRVKENGDLVCPGGIEPAAMHDVGKLIGYLIEVVDYYFPSASA